MRDLSERWLLFAGQDLRMAELAMTEDLYGQACLHCQLCAERAIKALLVQQGRTPPDTPRLADLLPLLDPNPLAGLALAVQEIDRFHTSVRHPEALSTARLEGLPDAEDAWEALAVARQTLEVIARAMMPP
jgi:HEPN domain-containing protein